MSTQAGIPAKKRPSGLASLLKVQNLRRTSQLAFVLFIAYSMYMHITIGDTVASPEAYCPFGGFETLYSFISSGGKTISHTHLSNVVLFGSLLALTVVARGSFCGWICPFGTLQEWLYGLSGWLQKHVPGLGSAVKALKAKVDPKQPFVAGSAPKPTIGQKLDHWLRYFRYVVLAWIIWGTVTYGVMVFRDVDPWAALLSIMELETYTGLAVLIAVAVAGLFVERAWCRYACPLGAVVGIVSKISPMRIQREGGACSGCAICDKKCPVGIKVAAATDITDTNCNMCLQCVDTCPKPGALELKLVLPGVKAQ